MFKKQPYKKYLKIESLNHHLATAIKINVTKSHRIHGNFYYISFLYVQGQKGRKKVRIKLSMNEVNHKKLYYFIFWMITKSFMFEREEWKTNKNGKPY